MLKTRPRAEWVQRLEAAGVPCSPIHSLPEALAHPQVQSLGIVQNVPDAGFTLTGLPITFDGQRPPMGATAPALGAHNTRHGLPAHTPKT